MTRIGDKPIGDARALLVFRNHFLGSDNGRKALLFLLEDLGTFESTPPVDAGDEANRRYGLRLLELVGVNHEANLPALIELAATGLRPKWPGQKESQDEESDA